MSAADEAIRRSKDAGSWTPGPWRATEQVLAAASGAEAWVWGPDGDAVAACYGNLALDSTAIADARLIVEACAMADALKGFIEACDSDDRDGIPCPLMCYGEDRYHFEDCPVPEARAILARITGEETS